MAVGRIYLPVYRKCRATVSAAEVTEAGIVCFVFPDDEHDMLEFAPLKIVVLLPCIWAVVCSHANSCRAYPAITNILSNGIQK